MNDAIKTGLKQLIVATINWGWPCVLSAISFGLLRIYNINDVCLPVWLLLVLAAMLLTLVIAVWRANWTWNYDDNDMVAILVPWLAQRRWFGFGKEILVTAIYYAKVDRRFLFPRGSTKRLLDKAMEHYGFVPLHKGANVAKYHHQSLPGRDNDWMSRPL